MANNETKLRGTIKKILFPRAKTADSDFVIAVFGNDDFEVVIKGNIYGAVEKEEIIVEGEWVEDKKYGLQFKVNAWEKPIPSTKDQAYELLSSSLVKGCGSKTARLIVDTLGDGAIETILEQKEACLLPIKGISKKNAGKIVASLSENFNVQNIIKHLAQYGVTVKMAIKLHKEYGSNAVPIILRNPYELTNLSMVGFDRADIIARNMGIAEDSLYRCEAAVIHIMREQPGHCYVDKPDLIRECQALLNKRSAIEIESTLIEKAINNLSRNKLQIEEDRVYLKQLYQLEKTLAQKVAELVFAKGPVMPRSKIARELIKYQARNKIFLNEKQQEAIYKIFENNVLLLTGGPGTGKTATIKAVVEIYRQVFPDHKIALCAPTGRASQNLSKIVEIEGKTIHRLLNWGARKTEDGTETTSIERDEANPLEEDFVIVDELSMADIELASCLFRALKTGGRILLVGDADQLPSVGPGAVLRDLLKSPVPSVRLTEIYRQAKNSLIVENAHRINNGQMICTVPGRKDFVFLERSDPQDVEETILACIKRLLEIGYKKEDILVLSPMKKGVAGVLSLNEKIKSLLNPPNSRKKELVVGSKSFRVGDIIIQNQRNDVNKGLYNGNMGLVKNICVNPDDPESREEGLLCEIWGNEIFLTREDITEYDFTTGYCITTHKSQGGQAKVVIAPVITNHYIMLTRNILYTAITRAEEMMIMVGQKKALAMAVKNTTPNLRKTFLSEKIEKYLAEKQKGPLTTKIIKC
jgi:exodeoxyribonuclease V alpha subunit